MKLEDTMLSEISQLQKDKCCMFYLHEGSKVVKFIESKSGMGGCQALGCWGGEGGVSKQEA